MYIDMFQKHQITFGHDASITLNGYFKFVNLVLTQINKMIKVKLQIINTIWHEFWENMYND